MSAAPAVRVWPVPGRAVLAAFVLAVLGASLALAPAAPAEAATACRTVGGAPASADGERHATVVVDTGSGTVWSACITLSAKVSGIGALDLAAHQIPELNPVYDTYAGEGRAVCKLRGTGNDPPDCLGKTAAYWRYERNGLYSPAGAGSVTVSDGDVEGWRWGTGSAQVRPATAGTEAATASVPSSRPPGATTTQPGTGPGVTTPTGNAHGATIGGATKGGGGTPLSGAPTTAAPGPAGSQSTIAGSASTTTPGAATNPAAGASSSGSRADALRRGDARGGGQAGAKVRSGSGPAAASDKKSESSGTTSAVALVGLLVLAAGAGVLVRKRRRAAVTEPQS